MYITLLIMSSIISMEPFPWTTKGEEWPIKIFSTLHELIEANKFLYATIWWVASESNSHSHEEKLVAERALGFHVSLLKKDRFTFKMCLLIFGDKTTNILKEQDSKWPHFPKKAYLRGLFWHLKQQGSKWPHFPPKAYLRGLFLPLKSWLGK